MKEREPSNKGETEFLTQQQLEAFAHRFVLRKKVAQALLLTAGKAAPGLDVVKPDGIREYGFAEFQFEWYQEGIWKQALLFSSLFKGKEEEIALTREYKNFITGLRLAVTSPGLSKPVLFFHTHPYLPQFSNILRFSEDDLHSFVSQIEDKGNTKLIEGVGVTHNGSSEEMAMAELLLVSFKDFYSFREFAPRGTYGKSVEYLKVPGKHPYDAYREAGLHVAHAVFPLRQTALITETPPQGWIERTPAVSGSC